MTTCTHGTNPDECPRCADACTIRDLMSDLAQMRRERDSLRAELGAPREQVPDGWVMVPKEPAEGMWGGLARDLIMWMDMHQRPTYKNLFKHMGMVGRDLPQELFDAPIAQLKDLDHVPAKGTRAVLIYRAMIAASQKEDKP